MEYVKAEQVNGSREGAVKANPRAFAFVRTSSVRFSGTTCAGRARVIGLRSFFLSSLMVALLPGCLRGGHTEVRVHDARAVAVVADSSSAPLLAPDGKEGRALVYRGANETATVERDGAGAIRYESEHWALQTRHDETDLVENDGRIAPDILRGSFGPLGGAALVGDQLTHEEVRIPIVSVRETSAFGTCADSPTPCQTQPPVHLALTTKKENVAEVTTVRSPVRPFGWVELPMGAILIGTGAIVGGEELAKSDGSSRTTGLAISSAALVLGGLLVANGLWYLTAPVERTTIYSDR